jgi:molybdopterin synthase catalytic subunit
MIEITSNPINTQVLLESVSSPTCGAAVLFVGTTRQFTDGRETEKLAYECYQPMAIKKLNELREAALEKWKIENCSIVHRIGIVQLEAASIAVAVSSPHRVASFEAASWIMDRLKKDVPIWKQEHWADGDRHWVHPENEKKPSQEVIR